MRVERVLDDSEIRIRTQPEQILRHSLAKGDVCIASGQEIFGQRSVEKALLMRDDIVKDGNHPAMLPHFSGNPAQRWRKI